MQSASFSGRPQKSIQQILSCCITPPAALCDVQISLLLFLIGFLLLLYFNPFCSVCQVLPPNSPALPDRIIHIVFHCHYFFHRNTFKNRHLHFKPYPEERIHTQCKKYGSGKSRIALRSVGSVEILQIINTVPAIPTSGSTGPNGTLKLLGAFGRRCRSTSTSICAKI